MHTARNLFGSDPAAVSSELSTELADLQAKQTETWNFDFSAERPTAAGAGYNWVRVLESEPTNLEGAVAECAEESPERKSEVPLQADVPFLGRIPEADDCLRAGSAFRRVVATDVCPQAKAQAHLQATISYQARC
eukprot:comp17551_c0_seq1/m.17137 comp17551_c0_seq1/g.17137  ORF comp17551_c0_seq1/g.17137 comp17551_c0_seq1/m.17137 type:complete len:135 (-) comp17551_c0_seq1:640-1044(-)